MYTIDKQPSDKQLSTPTLRWFNRVFMLLPLLAFITLFLLLIKHLLELSLLDPTTGTWGVDQFIGFSPTAATGLLVDAVWWQSAASSVFNAIGQALLELACALLLLRLIRDNLPLQQFRCTLLIVAWLVPAFTAQEIFVQLIDLTTLNANKFNAHFLAEIWRNSGTVAVAMYLWWPTSLEVNRDIVRVYPVTPLHRLQLLFALSRPLLWFLLLALVILHTDISGDWLQAHLQASKTVINYDDSFLRQTSAANTLSLLFTVLLTIALLRAFNKLESRQ